jgi:hypothetical protein
MKIIDAKPGQAITDRHGDVWVRTATGATMVANSNGRGRLGAVVWSEEDLQTEADAHFGPFTLVEGCEDV